MRARADREASSRRSGRGIRLDGDSDWMRNTFPVPRPNAVAALRQIMPRRELKIIIDRLEGLSS